ncbi:MAG: glutathione S-transferase domain-containing protein [Gammaproteobacteria bacterium]|nr:glutathione S-transferase domain-containing protein [Gammaproteobacteria bacterium]
MPGPRRRSHDGTVGGVSDPQKHNELRFWESANESGITDEQVAASVARFRTAFDQLNETLHHSNYILRETLTVVDIAWYIYAARVIAAGYPLHRLHEHVGEWFDMLDSRPEFHREIEMPARLKEASAAPRRALRDEGRSLEAVGGSGP